MIPSSEAPKRTPSRKRSCRFCADYKIVIDYKEAKLLLPFTTDRAKIVPRRMTGNCAYHQRRVTEAIKRARILALLPFVGSYQGL
ncbi:MAG: 30S ribosomal protein S18 [Deltaproteobacteria bacterium]|nr:30S ribosomal protein S18 [Deltaproteobacteria bacterium]MBI4374300.1 30S ribosomal protein S18 [Deltaproteobacteria bacterium]